MKLICELQEAVDYELIEASSDKPKQYFIEGIFMQSETKNKNGRIYPLEVLEKEYSSHYQLFKNTATLPSYDFQCIFLLFTNKNWSKHT